MKMRQSLARGIAHAQCFSFSFFFYVEQNTNIGRQNTDIINKAGTVKILCEMKIRQ